MYPGNTVSRPYFGKNQVRSKDELKHGMKVRWRYGDHKAKWETVNEIVMRNISTGPALFFTVLENSWENSLADKGVIPYKDGTWNSKHWLEKKSFSDVVMYIRDKNGNKIGMFVAWETELDHFEISWSRCNLNFDVFDREQGIIEAKRNITETGIISPVHYKKLPRKFRSDFIRFVVQCKKYYKRLIPTAHVYRLLGEIYWKHDV